MNALHIIFPYRHKRFPTTWVFDDEKFGLVEEPLVLGASEALERVVQKKYPDGADRVQVVFSNTPVPGADLRLKRAWSGVFPERMGCAYHDGTEELWLCPAMTNYFGTDMAPKEIYLSVKRIEKEAQHPAPTTAQAA